MSASLVGSEMCIRDSHCVYQFTQFHGFASGFTGFHGSFTGRARANREPVSYTHLTLPTICSV
eukprot:4067635-Alexandrium_andersonii.AAC.1